MYYRIQGEGYPLVLIMGMGSNLDWCTPFSMLEQLSKNFKVITFDNRDSGRTDAPETDSTIEMMAEDAKGLMDALNVEQAHVLGASMGGDIAEIMAINYPDKINKLVLCCADAGNTTLFPTSPEAMELGMKLIQEKNKAGKDRNTEYEIAKLFLPLLFPQPFNDNNQDTIETTINTLLIAPMGGKEFMKQMNAKLKFDIIDKLPQIAKPTLIMHGKEDIVVPYKNAEYLAEHIPGAELVSYDKGGHLFLYQEPEDVMNRVIEFLKK
ncbi:MAG: alpha/beta fold hydrolase [Candidatus Thorarchaeota archaeon]